MAEFHYPQPTASPYSDIAQYVPLLLTAIDAALDRGDVWDDFTVANGYVEDLKAWIQDFIAPMTIQERVTEIVLYESELGSAGLFDIDLSALSDYADCTELELRLKARGDASFTLGFVRLILNSDTTLSNYDATRTGQGSVATDATYNGTARIATVCGSNQLANAFTDFAIFIPLPHETHLKKAYSQGSSAFTTTNAGYDAFSLFWNNAAALTQVKLDVENANANFAAATRLQIIGRKVESVYVAG